MPTTTTEPTPKRGRGRPSKAPTKTYALRLPLTILAELKRIADRDERSMAATVRRILRASVEKHGAGSGD